MWFKFAKRYIYALLTRREAVERAISGDTQMAKIIYKKVMEENDKEMLDCILQLDKERKLLIQPDTHEPPLTCHETAMARGPIR